MNVLGIKLETFQTLYNVKGFHPLNSKTFLNTTNVHNR